MIILQKDQSFWVLFVNVVNTFDHTEVFSCTIVLHCEQASSIHVLRVNIHYKVLHILCLGLSVVVVTQKLSNLSLFCFLQWHIVRVATENVLELALQLVYIVIVLSCKIEFDFFVLDDCSLFLLRLFVELLLQVINDAIIVMTMLLPKLAQLFWWRFHDLEFSITDL